MIEGPKQDRIQTMADGIAAEAKKEFKTAPR
jgi:hypothetical protein